MTTRDLETKLTRFDAPTRAGVSSPAILMPGIPEFSQGDLGDLINGTNFRCSTTISDAAINIARAAAGLFAETATVRSLNARP